MSRAFALFGIKFNIYFGALHVEENSSGGVFFFFIKIFMEKLTLR